MFGTFARYCVSKTAFVVFALIVSPIIALIVQRGFTECEASSRHPQGETFLACMLSESAGRISRLLGLNESAKLAPPDDDLRPGRKVKRAPGEL